MRRAQHSFLKITKPIGRSKFLPKNLTSLKCAFSNKLSGEAFPWPLVGDMYKAIIHTISFWDNTNTGRSRNHVTDGAKSVSLLIGQPLLFASGTIQKRNHFFDSGVCEHAKTTDKKISSHHHCHASVFFAAHPRNVNLKNKILLTR